MGMGVRLSMDGSQQEISARRMERSIDFLLGQMQRWDRERPAPVRLSVLIHEFLTLVELDEVPLDLCVKFLRKAARLTKIRASNLVPEAAPEEGEPESEMPDRSGELIQYLEEYRRYREAAEKLDQRAKSMQKRHRRLPPEVAEWENALADIAGADLSDLMDALEELLSDEPPEEVQVISGEEIKVADCIEQIKERLQTRGPLRFRDVFPTGAGRRIIVVTFIALLELVRNGLVRVRQREEFGDIVVFSVEENSSSADEINKD